IVLVWVFLLAKGAAELRAMRVLIVDDFQAWRDFARRTLEKLSGLLIVAEASDGFEAVRKAEEHQPDLVVLDIGLPRLNGIEVAHHIRRICRTSKIVFLTTDHLYDAADPLPAGVSACIHKSRAARELAPAVEAAFNGVRQLSRAGHPTRSRALSTK